MARIRTIKPEFFKDKKVHSLGYAERLLFIGLWTLADDQGYLWWDPYSIECELFPRDDVDIEQMLAALCQAGMIQRVATTKGKDLVYITKLLDHQKISNPSKPKLELLVSENIQSPLKSSGGLASATESSEILASTTEDSVVQHVERKGKERKGKRNRKESIPPKSPKGELVEDEVPEPDSIPGENHHREETPSESEPSLPESLRTPEFQTAFAEWLAFKRERGEKYKPTGLRKLISTLEKWGPEVAIERINFSISSNYAGIFPPKSSNARASPRGGWQAPSEPVQTEEDLIDIGTEEGLRELEKLAAGGAFGRRRSAVPEPQEVDF